MKESGAAATEGGRGGELDLRRVRERVLAKGFTVQQLESCLDEYAAIDVSGTILNVCLFILLTRSIDLANCCRGYEVGLHRDRRV